MKDQISHQMKLRNIFLTVCLIIDLVAMPQSNSKINLPLLQNSFNDCLQSGDFKKAIEIGLELKEFQLKNVGKNSDEYIETLGLIAFSFNKLNQSDSAIEYSKEQLKIAKILYGEKSAVYAFYLEYLSKYYSDSGNCIEAEKAELISVGIYKDVFGGTSYDYAQSVMKLSLIYSGCFKDYKKAIELDYEFVKLIKAQKGNNSFEYAQSLDILALDLADIGECYKAIETTLNTLKIKELILHESDPSLLLSLQNLALFNSYIGEYGNAIEICKKVKAIQEKELPKNIPDYLRTIIALAGYYSNNYEFYESINECNKTLPILKTYDKKLAYSNILETLSRAYFGVNNYTKAKELKSESLEIKKNILGIKHPDYLESLDNDVLNYIQIGDYDYANNLALSSLKIKKVVLGENHPNYAISLNNYAFVLYLEGEFTDALEYATKAINILGDCPASFLSFQVIAYSNFQNGDYAKAILNFKKIIETSDTKISSQPLFADILKEIAFSYAELSDFKNANSNILNSKILIEKIVSDKFIFLTERERENLWTIESNFYEHSFPSYSYKYYGSNPSISSFAYDNEIFAKGLLLSTYRKIQQSIINSGDTTMVRRYQEMKEKRNLINFLESQPIEKQYNLQELKDKAYKLDKELTKKSQIYNQAQTDLKIQWQDIQRQLKDNEAAIEFIMFSYYNKHWTDSTLYFALVLKKGMEYPVMVPLFEQKQLDSLLVGGNAAPNNLYASRGVTAYYENQLPNGPKLYKLIWEPLEKELQDVKTVYYSPSGSLHQISFVALPTDTSNYLCDKYNLLQLSSTRQLATSAWQTKSGQISSTALFGGIKYDLENQEIAELKRSLLKNEIALSQGFTPDSSFRSTSFGFLPGTKDEVNSISTTLQAKKIKTVLYSGINGNEEAFKALTNQNISVLHIATHGFFYPDEKENPQELDRMMLMGEQKFRYVPNPLRRSGLILAGGNRTWKGEEPVAGMEDGILTAQEISEMNLQNTELVVLSACETGLGDIKGGEGVFGLQRAFKLAGVKTIIMSLWKVPDGSTSEMMQLFYSKWLGGMDKQEAFRETQREMRNRYPKSPKDWAGFVMLD